MKQQKRLTRDQKIAASASGYLPDNWMLVEQTEFYLKIIHKLSRTARRAERYAIPRREKRR